MRSRYDAIIIGAGHNGLVAAAYLARHGLATLSIERNDRIGGACITDEIMPGYRVSGAACCEWIDNFYGLLPLGRRAVNQTREDQCKACTAQDAAAAN